MVIYIASKTDLRKLPFKYNEIIKSDNLTTKAELEGWPALLRFKEKWNETFGKPYNTVELANESNVI